MSNIIGFDELERQFNLLSLVGQRQVLTRAAKAGAEVIRSAAASNAPRRTGRLAETMTTSISGRDTSIDQAVVRIGAAKTAFYGSFLERGTRFIHSRPFLQPAFEQNVDQAIETASEVLKQEIERIAAI